MIKTKINVINGAIEILRILSVNKVNKRDCSLIFEKIKKEVYQEDKGHTME